MNCNRREIINAYKSSHIFENDARTDNDLNYPLKVAIIGHPYNIYDSYLNMNLKIKLNKLGVGVITEENLDKGKK